MNKNIMVALAFSLLAMFSGMTTILIIQTAMIHAGLIVAVCFGVVGFAGFMAIAACAWVIHNEGRQKQVTIR